MKGKLLFIVVGALVVVAVFYPEVTRRVIGQSTAWVTKMAGIANPTASHYTSPWTAATPAPASPTPPPRPQPEISEAQAKAQARSIVQAYLRKNTMAGTTITFLGSSDFSRAGSASAITVLYKVQTIGEPDQVVTVRFELQDGAVANAQVLSPGAPRPAPLVPREQPVYNAGAAPAPLAQQPAKPLEVTDHFSSALSAAKHGPHRTMRLSDAYSLAHLEDAKAKAKAERKPLGFLMVWGQFFDHEADSRGKGSDSALVHFYDAFHSKLVLVFVRHETELGSVPPAVSQGFTGPDEGGYAPNMAVTDATASEFIVEIPYSYMDGDGRDPVFAEKAKKIDEWWAAHPDAVGTAPTK